MTDDYKIQLDTLTPVDERWRPVVGMEGFYEVSDFGRVCSCVRRDRIGRLKGGVILSDAAVCKKGYRRVTMRVDGCQTHSTVHRLVLEAFVGKRPVGMVACHADGDPNNNRLENLRWDTYSANEYDKREHGTAQIGERNGMAVLTTAKVIAIRRMLRFGISQYKIASRFGVKQPTIYEIKRGKTWRHVDV